MKDGREWTPCYGNVPCPALYPGQREFPWLYPYGSQMNCWNLWNNREQMEDEMDTRRLRELYPLMARRLQPYVEEVCTRLEYPGSMMYDEYPDQLSLRSKAREVWDSASTGWGKGAEVGRASGSDRGTAFAGDDEAQKKEPGPRDLKVTWVDHGKKAC